MLRCPLGQRHTPPSLYLQHSVHEPPSTHREDDHVWSEPSELELELLHNGGMSLPGSDGYQVSIQSDICLLVV